MKESQIKIHKQVPGVGQVEFTGHFIGGNLEDVSWYVLEFSNLENAKIADVADEIKAEEFETETA